MPIHTPPRASRRLTALLPAAALLLGSAAAVAAPPAAAAPGAAAAPAGPDAATKAAAREAYGAGEKAYQKGDYTGALAEFQKAHGLIPTIHAQYWIALCQAQKGADPAAAYAALEAVVGAPDAAKLGEEKLGTARAKLAELGKLPAEVEVTSTPPGAEVSVDDLPQPGLTPVKLSLAPGAHRVAVSLKGHRPFEAQLNVRPGEKLSQAATLEAAPAAAAAAPPPAAAAAAEPAAPAAQPAEPRSMLPAYVTLGVGAVAAGVGTVFGLKALSAKSDFDDKPTNASADDAERNALIADMAFGVALTLGVTGIVLLVSDDDSSELAAEARPAPRRAGRLDVAPVITPTTQGAAARLLF